MKLGAYAELEFDLAGALRQRLVTMFSDMGSAALTAAEVGALVPEEQGVYQLFLDEELVYIGKTDAEDGLRKRLTRHAAKIQHRVNLDPSRVTFRAIRLYVFTVMDLETELLRQRRPSWNGGGFGSNDPGRERDTTKIKEGNFDDLYPIDVKRDVGFRLLGSHPAHEGLQAIRAAVPWTIRSQNAGGRSRRPHPDLALTHVILDPAASDAWTALSSLVEQLPVGWQLTALKSHVVLYREDKTYPDPLGIVHSRAKSA